MGHGDVAWGVSIFSMRGDGSAGPARRCSLYPGRAGWSWARAIMEYDRDLLPGIMEYGRSLISEIMEYGRPRSST